MKKGIDVSQFQGVIDWEKVKNSGIEFAIIRAGYGRYISQKDPYFDINYKNAKAFDIPVGAYWYSYATSAEDAVAEAKTCLEVIINKKFELPIYFDIEENSQLAKGKDFCSALVKNFCDTLENSGYFAGFYTSRNTLQNFISDDVKTRYATWVAEWGVNSPNCSGWGMWQYSDSGKIGGISGKVDLNCLNYDYEAVIKKTGLNGFSKHSPADAEAVLTKSIAKITIEVDGKTFVGELTEK